MKFTALLAIVSAVALNAATVAAHPASPYVKRDQGCSVVSPSGGARQNITISRTLNTTTPARVTFAVPEDAAGPCNLVAGFPKDSESSRNLVTTGGSQQLNVFAEDGPAAGSLVGTATFAADGARHTINSFECRPQLAFRFEIAGRRGSVRFTQLEDAGLSMNFAC